MYIHTSKHVRIYAFGMAVLGWFAVIMQFYLMFLNWSTPLGEMIMRFFSFFTILTNIIVAFAFTAMLVNTKTLANPFFIRANTFSAITVYILVVGLVYNLILRFSWNPEGLHKIVDELLHTVIPLLSVIFWCLFVPKQGLRWKNAFMWLLYPAVYSLFIGIRAAVSGFYPYPFINIPAIGYRKTFVNGVFVFATFLFISLLLIAAGKMISRHNKATQL